MHSVRSVAFFGSEAKNITVECDIANGLPYFSIVGLPDASVQESRERVRSALKNSTFTFPAKRVTVNLAPTNIRKSGSAFDLPIAIAILSGERKWKKGLVESALFFGELGLDGSLKPTSGALPASILAKKQ